jgi:hypothetical protein
MKLKIYSASIPAGFVEQETALSQFAYAKGIQDAGGFWTGESFIPWHAVSWISIVEETPNASTSKTSGPAGPGSAPPKPAAPSKPNPPGKW